MRYHVHLNVEDCFGIFAQVTVTVEAEDDNEAQATAYRMLGDCETCDVAEIEEVPE